MTARTGRDPCELYDDLTRELGAPVYERLDAPASLAQVSRLKALKPEDVSIAELAGEPVLSIESAAPETGDPLGGLRVKAKTGWFAVRPSGTEPMYKIYAESFVGPEHLRRIQYDAQSLFRDATTDLTSRQRLVDEDC
jgi:phosphoglucomutase